MRKNLFLLGTILLLAACSSPKYTYHFDHYDYNSGRKQQSQKLVQDKMELASPLALQEEALVATTEKSPVVLTETEGAVATEAKATLKKKYNAMTKAECKEFRQEIKGTMKAYLKAKKEGNSIAAEEATNALDHDLKLAIIFGAIGLTLELFGGVNSVFWILGVIAVVIG